MKCTQHSMILHVCSTLTGEKRVKGPLGSMLSSGQCLSTGSAEDSPALQLTAVWGKTTSQLLCLKCMYLECWSRFCVHLKEFTLLSLRLLSCRKLVQAQVYQEVLYLRSPHCLYSKVIKQQQLTNLRSTYFCMLHTEFSKEGLGFSASLLSTAAPRLPR